MPMPPYPVICYRKECGQSAHFKIAARWSDGVTGELKTYFLACTDCLPDLYRSSCVKQAACRTAPGEILEQPGIFELERGKRDRELKRRLDLEQKLQMSGTGPLTGTQPTSEPAPDVPGCGPITEGSSSAGKEPQAHM